MILSSVALISCREETKQTEEEDLEKAPPTTPAGEIDENNKSDSDNSTAKVNPKHGEPDHRCDIPVGAPLDQATSQTSSENNEMNESPIRLRSSKPKINPPHGKPGHDCSVPVGAELEG